jgi:hypothetical protein
MHFSTSIEMQIVCQYLVKSVKYFHFLLHFESHQLFFSLSIYTLDEHGCDPFHSERLNHKCSYLSFSYKIRKTELDSYSTLDAYFGISNNLNAMINGLVLVHKQFFRNFIRAI